MSERLTVASIIFDWKGTLYHAVSQTLFPGATELLESLQGKGLDLTLFGKGDWEMYHMVGHLKVGHFFTYVKFQPGEKNPSEMRKYLAPPPFKTLVIGDRPQSEIEVGNLIRAITGRIKHGPYANEQWLTDSQRPSFEVDNLGGLRDYIQRRFILKGAYTLRS